MIDADVAQGGMTDTKLAAGLKFQLGDALFTRAGIEAVDAIEIAGEQTALFVLGNLEMTRADEWIGENHLIAIGAADGHWKSIHRDALADAALAVEDFDIA